MAGAAVASWGGVYFAPAATTTTATHGSTAPAARVMPSHPHPFAIDAQSAPTKLTGRAGAVSAASRANIFVASVHITSNQPANVRATLTDPSVLGSLGWADWNMARNASYTPVGFWSLWEGHATDTTQWFPDEALGTWHALPDGDDNSNAQHIPQNTVAFYIREGSRISLRAVRSGRSVKLSAHVTRYNDDEDFGLHGGWVVWPGQIVTISYLSAGKWHAVKCLLVGKKGSTASVTLPASREYHATDGSSVTIWGATSNTVR